MKVLKNEMTAGDLIFGISTQTAGIGVDYAMSKPPKIDWRDWKWVGNPNFYERYFEPGLGYVVGFTLCRGFFISSQQAPL